LKQKSKEEEVSGDCRKFHND